MVGNILPWRSSKIQFILFKAIHDSASGLFTHLWDMKNPPIKFSIGFSGLFMSLVPVLYLCSHWNFYGFIFNSDVPRKYRLVFFRRDVNGPFSLTEKRRSFETELLLDSVALFSRLLLPAAETIAGQMSSTENTFSVSRTEHSSPYILSAIYRSYSYIQIIYLSDHKTSVER